MSAACSANTRINLNVAQTRVSAEEKRKNLGGDEDVDAECCWDTGGLGERHNVRAPILFF